MQGRRIIFGAAIRAGFRRSAANGIAFFSRPAAVREVPVQKFRGIKMSRFLFAAAATALLAAAPALAETTVLTHVTVIDGTGAADKPDSAIVMPDGKIAYVGPMAGLKAPSGARTEDMSGK